MRAFVGRVSGNTGSSAPRRESSKALLLIGGLSFDVTPACWCYTPSTGSPEKHGSAIDGVKKSSVQVGSLRPKGIPGFLYWKLLQPVHRRVFQALAQHRVTHTTHEEEPDCCEQFGTSNSSLNGVIGTR